MAFENFQFAKFEVATFCTQGPSKGALAVMAYVLDRFDFATNMGIFKCRGTGSGSLSHHAEGRADDEGVPTKSGAARPELGLQIVNLFGPHAKTLGIDHMIYNLGGPGRGKPYIWSAKDPNGRPYTGVDPHKNHIHKGLNRNAAKNLTYAKLVSVLGPANAPVPPPVPQPPPPAPAPPGDVMLPLKQDQRSEDVRLLKDRMNETFAGTTGLGGVAYKTLDIASDEYGDWYEDATVNRVRDFLGAGYTGHPDGKKGTWVGGNQWNALEILWIKRKLGL